MDATPRIDGPALIVQETGQVYRLAKEPLTIGRKAENTIVLPTRDLKASRYHAVITWQDGRYLLEDAGSANGTFLNNRRLAQAQPLSDGDIVGVGDTRLLVSLPAADTKPSLHPEPDALDQTIVGDQTLVGGDTLVGRQVPRFLENPYVGPRTFTSKEGDRFFGREIEARELFSLIISERLVLFYAQSGAGKSSLINARLIPQLQEAGFPVLPVARVSGELPPDIGQVDNIYMFNLMLSMDESDSDPRQFAAMSLSDFLAGLTSLDGVHYFYAPPATAPLDEEEFQPSPYVLFIDQFEEIITTHPDHWREREAFFEQLAEAMQKDPYLWIVLSLREDYVAALDPYAQLLPGHMRARFYMQRMSYSAALEAITRPAEQFGRVFAPGVAESLVDNLRQIRVPDMGDEGQVKTELGQFVEPVQLQVVCYQLWENLIGHPTPRITYLDLEELGDVDQALADFYEQALADVTRELGVSEIDLRTWFDSELITEAGTRGTVYRGKETSGGIDNAAVDMLVDQFLLRSEVRTGGTWYELVHDRFIEPIVQSNQAWRLQQPLIKFAQDWARAGKPESLLLEGQPLKEALTTNWEGLGPLVEEFLDASQAAQKAKEEVAAAEKLRQAQALAAEQQKRLEEEARASARLRRRALWITVVGVVAFIMAVAAGIFAWVAFRSQQVAEANAEEAIAAQLEAENSRATAQAGATQAAAESTRAAANEAEARRLLENQLTAQAVLVTAADESNSATATAVAWLRVTLTVQAATSEAPTATPVPTDTPLPPTSTPTGTFTPPPTDTPTPTPTATATATPNLVATQQVQILQQAIGQFEESQQLSQTSCKIEPAGAFARVWSQYPSELGCPLYQEPRGGYFAEQPFQNGYMFWYSIYDVIIVTVGDDTGWWESFTKAETDSYGPSNEGSCQVTVPRGLFQPVRGFGAIWCGREDIREEIGFATANEFGTTDTLLQEFENGLTLLDSRKRIFVLLKKTEDSGSYIQTR